jgi:hypothetical protein
MPMRNPPHPGPFRSSARVWVGLQLDYDMAQTMKRVDQV